MNSQGLNFNLTIFNCLIAVTMLELLGMLRRSHYVVFPHQGGTIFPLFSILKGYTNTRCQVQESGDPILSMMHDIHVCICQFHIEIYTLQ